MSERAVEALRAERDEVLAVARALRDEEWEAPSDCDGWRVHDVVAHMASVFRQIVDPSSVPTTDGPDVERDAELPVAERRAWPHHEVLAEYEEISAQGIGTLGGFQAPELAETVVPLKNLGAHPLHLLADAIVFDHYCHLRKDILRPLGPIERPPPPGDDLRLEPVVRWMLAGLPQMNGEALARIVTEPITLELGGPGGGRWTLQPAGDGVTIAADGADTSATVVRSTADDFVVWGTQRRDWRQCGVDVTGDETYAAAVLDAINVI
jgi:uncharacterized protein (TIGR03083 family)